MSALFILVICNQIFAPSVLYALTSGPTQPEVQSFQPASTSDMVDLFTGDFSYNIPLFELPGPNGGYPFNLSYQAGIGMDQEASWVGLGWNLNPGAITRQMRGLPDEFNGDKVHTKMDMNPSVTVGLSGGVGLEVFGGDAASLGVGFGVTHNNYKGLGYSIDASINYGGAVSSEMNGGIGLRVSLDSKEGANVSPSLGLEGLTIGMDYNSKQGLQSISLTQSSTKAKNSYEVANSRAKEGDTRKKSWGSSISNTSALSLSHPGYTPQMTMPMKNVSLSATFKLGGAWWGVFAAPYVRGFYNEQWLKNRNKNVSADAYGYLNYQNGTDSKAMLDFNREKDGMVTKESPNLAIPSMTYDIYSASGQGMAAMYRPMRNDFGVLWDAETISTATAGSAGVDVGPGASHVGVNLSINHSKSVSGKWTGGADALTDVSFKDHTINSAYEPWYFKVHGEPDTESTALINSLGGDKAVRMQLTGDNHSPSLTGQLELRSGSPGMTAPKNSEVNQERRPRNQVIQPFTKDQLMSGGKEILSYFQVSYLDINDAELPFDRTAYPGHHITAFTALSTEGLRYNYGIPAYNHYQEDVTFSARKQAQDVSRVSYEVKNNEVRYDIPDTEQFFKKVQLPPYAHSHLLTSIIGPDYVDVDGNGVSDKDLGYWVKFTYKKTASKDDPYKWRDPYSNAHLLEGWKSDPRDDKGSYTYGEKEIWYLARAETKSHVAEFDIVERKDGKGVLDRLQTTDGNGKSLHKLKSIKLYTRSAGPSFPIKVTRFLYEEDEVIDNSLCKGVYNSTGAGKLTLKKVWFEYGNSARGSFNPYEFKYNENEANYNMLAYDRWGNYKPYLPKPHDHNRNFPYVEQDPSELKKAELDRNAAAWSLKEILLPSGGKIIVDYETDDYGYVQHLPAMQMMQIAPPSGDPNAQTFNLSDTTMKVRFKLESPISGTLTPQQQKDEVLKYLDRNRKQLFFKYKINLRSPSEDNEREYINGYVDIDFGTDADMGLDNGGTGDYKYGYFSVVKEVVNGNNRNPFSLRAWQHLRTNQPELANSGRKLKQTDNTGERVNQIKSLGSILTQVRQMFEGFYSFCSDKDWGREVLATESWIRLNSPDKIKYGGGVRVRQITMKDNWAEDEEGIYGQIYEYTTNENGKTISSGVAAYEPIVGGEENPFRYAKKYAQAVPLRSKNNLFFEYPINESYYPGPQVGYRKVTVISLATAALFNKTVTHEKDKKKLKNIDLTDDKKLFGANSDISFGTTGMTTHEFYTAKDFPVITSETEKANRPYKLTVPVPLLGNISISKLTASQGYSIVTNDMHGKQKKVSTYRQDPNGKFEPDPISWVQYNYLNESRMYDQQRVFTVKNELKDNGDGTLSIPDPQDLSNRVTVGQENELFYDMREFEDKAWGGGAAINTDGVWIPLLFVAVPVFIPSVWPNISKSTTQLRTIVTNKVIFKSGILESIEAFDGGSIVKTQNWKWDKQTGATVLTRVNNNFDESVYSHTIPAYTQYKGMGAAYRNIGLTFGIMNLIKTEYKETLYNFSATTEDENLFPGDEILLFNPIGTFKNPIAKVVYMGNENGSKIFHSDIALPLPGYKAMIVRSGFRNQLTVSAGTVTALQDPSMSAEVRTYPKTVKVPR